jgi:hypothetical protein
MKRVKFLSALGVVAFALVACGSETESEFGEAGNPNNGSGVPSGSNGLPDIGPQGTGSACVTEVAGAELAPTNLIFMYDKSGSMGYLGDDPTFDPNKKWIPVGQGMKSFFSDPYSKTLRASLQFFPDGDLPDPPGPPDEQRDVNEVCSFDYATPKVALTSAADPKFVTTIDSTTPAGGTPTAPALKGAITYAEQIAASRPGEKTAVVFVTDGEPGFMIGGQFVPGCENMPNTIEEASKLATGALAKQIPTYVVGVGPALGKLNAIASAGGTTSAIMVDISDPTKTAEQIRTALNDIRKREATCDFAMPPPPEGETLDPNAVNVVLKLADGTDSVLGYSQECSDPSGWKYDNAAAPTRILLCSASCNDAKASTEGKVTIAFGCKTKISVR